MGFLLLETRVRRRDRTARRWRSVSTLVAALLLGGGAAPASIVPDPQLAQHVMTLTRATSWTRVAAIKLRFRTFHPQGMVRIGRNFYLSSVEVRVPPKKLSAPRDGHGYDLGVGVGHLFKFGPNGTLLGDLLLGEGTVYHPGGIDYDGESIWVPVAQYRPGGRSIIYRVAPDTMRAVEVLRVGDHIGGVVHDRDGKAIVGMNWGSRRMYGWPIADDGTVSAAGETYVNPESYIDYQDCHYVGGRLMLCAGLAEYRPGPKRPAFPLGGLDLVDLSARRPVWQTPVPLWAPSGRAMTQNPVWMEASATGLRAWFLPDDDRSTLFVYDAVTR